MIWKSYKSLTGEFSQLEKDQVFFVKDKAARDTSGDSLPIDTDYVRKEAKKKTNKKFEYLGDKEMDTLKSKTQEELPLNDDIKDKPPKPTEEEGGRFIVVEKVEDVEGFEDLEKARQYAESLNKDNVAVAEVKGILKIETIKKWEESNE